MGSIPGPTFDGVSYNASYAKSLHEDYLLELYNAENKSDATRLPDSRYRVPVDGIADPKYGDRQDRICIIGAGVAGLSVALSLHKAGFENIDILEASDRAGGRLFTYQFPNTDGCKHNYCDIGAMRIPEISRMNATFGLIESLGLSTKAKPYYYKLKDQQEIKELPEKQRQLEPELWWFEKDRPKSEKFEAAMKGLMDEFKFEGDFDAAMQRFLSDKRRLDTFSTRAWLMNVANPRFDFKDTVLAEAATTGRVGSFDQGLLETICDWADFQAAEGKPWFRLEGGMKVVVDAMVSKVEEKHDTSIHYGAAVISLRDNEPVWKEGDEKLPLNDERRSITVYTTDGKERTYRAVFNTAALPCLQRMDTSELRLPRPIHTGIRTLNYDRATKVAIKFKTAWWRKWLQMPGGVSACDLPVSNIVYPSWPIKDGESAVLLASYSWSQDATRMGALFKNTDPKTHTPDVDAIVVTQCLKNIAQVWAETLGKSKAEVYKMLRGEYVDHFAYAWSHDPYQGGAFALFGPGQFRDIYPPFQLLYCANKFAMCGEALSAEHGWISGALKSSYTSVLTWLAARKDTQGQAALKKSRLGGGRGEHPEEIDENILYWTVKLGGGFLGGDPTETGGKSG